MDIIRLYNDHNIPYSTEGGKHNRPGWVQTHCPFCTGNAGEHLGYSLNGDYFNCYRCGKKDSWKTISELLGIPLRNAGLLIQNYTIGRQTHKPPIESKEKQVKRFVLPSGLTSLNEKAKKYLIGRGFVPEELEKLWHLKSTSPVSTVNGSPYSHRIFIPYVWEGETVSFDTRDVTGRASEKYKACQKEREIIEHKHILYGNWETLLHTDIAVCLEGPTDVWRFGVHSFATSGIKYTQQQVRLIAKMFKVVFVCFDSRSETSKELQAGQSAKRLVAELRVRGVFAEVAKIPSGDPGGMNQVDADLFVQNLINKGNQYLKVKQNGK